MFLPCPSLLHQHPYYGCSKGTPVEKSTDLHDHKIRYDYNNTFGPYNQPSPVVTCLLRTPIYVECNYTFCFELTLVDQECGLCDDGVCTDCCGHLQACGCHAENFCMECECCESCCSCEEEEESYDWLDAPEWAHLAHRSDKSDQRVKDLCIAAKETNPTAAMADFYLLSWIEASATNPSSDSELGSALGACGDVAMAMRQEIVNDLAPTFAEYLEMACAGEARHEGSLRNVLGSVRTEAMSRWATVRHHHADPSILDSLANHLSALGNQQNGYGGEAWVNAVSILQMFYRNEIPAWAFVDRVFTMQHNNGTILSKVQWGGSLDHIDTIGNAHAAFQTDLGTLLSYASPKVYDLLMSFWTIRNRAFRAARMPMAIKPQRLNSAIERHLTTLSALVMDINPDRVTIPA